jgi:hypothetical protein
MAKTSCKILGALLILAGVAGFFVPNLLGLHLTPAHNLIHILTGALAAYFGFAGTSKAAHLFSRVGGVIYLLVGALGFIAPEVTEKIFQIHDSTGDTNLTPDNVALLLVGGVFLIISFLYESRPRTLIKLNLS